LRAPVRAGDAGAVRWLYHVVSRAEYSPEAGDYAPASLAREGFVHTSFREQVQETLRLHFRGADPAALVVLAIDPRRLPAHLELAPTPRGLMPHVFGPIPRDAIRARLSVDALEGAPDEVRGTRFGVVAATAVSPLVLAALEEPLARLRALGLDPAATVLPLAALAPAAPPPLHDLDVLVLVARTAADPILQACLARWPENRLRAELLLEAALGSTDPRRDEAPRFEGAAPASGPGGAQEFGQRLVAFGPAAAHELGLALVARLCGPEARTAVARAIGEEAGSRSEGQDGS
jgi:uncharacterized protein (DUF952 family)